MIALIEIKFEISYPRPKEKQIEFICQDLNHVKAPEVLIEQIRDELFKSNFEETIHVRNNNKGYSFTYWPVLFYGTFSIDLSKYYEERN